MCLLTPWNDGSGDYPSILFVDLVVSTLAEVKTKNRSVVALNALGLAWRLPGIVAMS